MTSNHPIYLLQQQELTFQRVLLFAENGQIEPALQILEGLLQKESKAEYLLAKGKLLAQSGQLAEAVTELQKIPESASLQWQAAQVAIQKATDLQQPQAKTPFNWRLFLKTWTLPFLLFLLLAATTALTTVYYKSYQQLTENVQLLSGKIDSNRQEVQDIDQAFERFYQSRQTEIDSLKTQITSNIGTLLSTNERQLQSLEGKHQATNTELVQLNKSLWRLSQQVKKMESGDMQNLQKQLEEIQKQFIAISKKIK